MLCPLDGFEADLSTFEFHSSGSGWLRQRHHTRNTATITLQIEGLLEECEDTGGRRMYKQPHVLGT